MIVISSLRSEEDAQQFVAEYNAAIEANAAERAMEDPMHFLDGHSAETAQLVVACLYEGDATATAALNAATDACANATTDNFLSELQTQAENWLAEREDEPDGYRFACDEPDDDHDDDEDQT